MTDPKTALILGATGGIGGEVAAALSHCGWRITALHRNPAKTARNSAMTWIQGNALNPQDVVRAAQGAALIVHAVNPPGYRNWSRWVLPMLDSSIQAARASGARILLPGTIYNYGPDAFPILREDSPQQPLTRKGKIRAEMEARLRRAADTGVRSLIVRAGDFFGPRAGNNWFSQGLVQPGKPVKSISYPGRPGSRPGDVRIKRFPWPAVILLSPFVTLFREMREMRYLWQEPLQLNNEKLLSVLGSETRTAAHRSCQDNTRRAGLHGGLLAVAAGKQVG